MRCAARISATSERSTEAFGRVPASTGVRSRARRGLCDHGAGAGDDLPGDASDQFRARGNGDVLDLFRLEVDGPGRALLVRLLRHRHRLVYPRGGDRAAWFL